MSPWQALLESLHSAWIDELNETLPHVKPELGLPRAVSGWELADRALSEGALAEVTLAGASGWILLCSEAGCASWAGQSLVEYTEGIRRRLGKEFGFRGISPQIGSFGEFEAATPPPGSASVGRLIWVPIRVDGRLMTLGVARFSG